MSTIFFHSKRGKRQRQGHDENSGQMQFLKTCMTQISQQARDGKRAADMRVSTKHQTGLTIYHIITSYPLLLEGLSRASHDPGQNMHTPETDCMGSVYADQLRKQHARNLGWQLRAARTPDDLKLGKPHRSSIPKRSRIHALPTTDDVATAWHDKPEQDDDAKCRHLTIHTSQRRAVAYAAARTLTWMLEHQWTDTVVAYRRGVSLVDACALLEQAAQATDRSVVLFVDIQDFFGAIPTQRLKQMLNQWTGYQDDPQLRNLIETLIGTKRKGIAQGCPLSPLLANVYAAMTLDKTIRDHGPTIRYSDDIAVLCSSVEHARQVFEQITHSSIGNGIRFSEHKCVIADLTSNIQYALDGTTVMDEPIPWLGFLPRLEADGMHFAQSNYSLHCLIDGLSRAKHHGPIQGAGPFDQFCHYLSRAVAIIEGWLQHYGWAERNDGQKNILQHIVTTCALTPTQLVAQAKALLRSNGYARDLNNQQKLKQLMHALNPHTDRRQKVTWDSIRSACPCLTKSLHDSRERATEIRSVPLDITWGMDNAPQHQPGVRLGSRHPDIQSHLNDPQDIHLPDGHITTQERPRDHDGHYYEAAGLHRTTLEELKKEIRHQKNTLSNNTFPVSPSTAEPQPAPLWSGQEPHTSVSLCALTNPPNDTTTAVSDHRVAPPAPITPAPGTSERRSDTQDERTGQTVYDHKPATARPTVSSPPLDNGSHPTIQPDMKADQLKTSSRLSCRSGRTNDRQPADDMQLVQATSCTLVVQAMPYTLVRPYTQLAQAVPYTQATPQPGTHSPTVHQQTKATRRTTRPSVLAGPHASTPASARAHQQPLTTHCSRPRFRNARQETHRPHARDTGLMPRQCQGGTALKIAAQLPHESAVAPITHHPCDHRPGAMSGPQSRLTSGPDPP